MNHSCEYVIKGCDCKHGVKEFDCDEVLCGEPATVKIYLRWYCERHAGKVQATLDRHEKGTPLPPDFFER